MGRCWRHECWGRHGRTSNCPRARQRGHTADSRLRALHANAGFHHHRHGPASHGAVDGGGADAPQPRHHLLPVELGRIHPDQRLGGGPLRCEDRVRRRDRRFYCQFRSLWCRTLARLPGRCPDAARGGRRDDGASRAAGHAENGSESGADARDVVSDRAGGVRLHPRRAGGRVHRHLFLLALDLLHQPAGRAAGHCARADADPECSGASRAAAGLARVHPVRPRACCMLA